MNTDEIKFHSYRCPSVPHPWQKLGEYRPNRHTSSAADETKPRPPGKTSVPRGKRTHTNPRPTTTTSCGGGGRLHQVLLDHEVRHQALVTMRVKQDHDLVRLVPHHRALAERLVGHAGLEREREVLRLALRLVPRGGARLAVVAEAA